jgi:hypothetical protein
VGFRTTDSRQPQAFQQPHEIDTSSNDDEVGPEQKRAMVLAEAPGFHSTASQLRSLVDTSLAPSKSFTQLAGLLPRMQLAGQRQVEQACCISELRQRSAALVVRWHEVFVLAQGRCWVEWETRLRRAERDIRRREVEVIAVQ